MFDGGEAETLQFPQVGNRAGQIFVITGNGEEEASPDYLNPNLPSKLCKYAGSPLLGCSVPRLDVPPGPPVGWRRRAFAITAAFSNALTNSPDAQSSSSAPFSQSFSPSHLHDNDTHLLVEPPQLNFSGGHVCMPVGRHKRE